MGIIVLGQDAGALNKITGAQPAACIRPLTRVVAPHLDDPSSRNDGLDEPDRRAYGVGEAVGFPVEMDELKRTNPFDGRVVTASAQQGPASVVRQKVSSLDREREAEHGHGLNLRGKATPAYSKSRSPRRAARSRAGPGDSPTLVGMARRPTTVELDEGVLDALRRAARAEGRLEAEVVEEALRRYFGLRGLAVLAEIAETQEASDVSIPEEEAMALAVEELRALRAERASRAPA